MTSQNDTKIFVCLHQKELPFIKSQVFQPIYVGEDLEIGKDIITDNSGDNIHEKNSRYGELTALYWIWKNYPIHDFVGLCHYRRYFWVKEFSLFYPISMSPLKFEDMKSHFAVTGEKYLKNADIVLPSSLNLKWSVMDQFSKYHDVEDLKMMRNILVEICPEYITAWDEVMQGNKINLIIMFITKNEIFNQYCSWLFPLMFCFDELDNRNRIGYQMRVNAFMAERLMNIFVMHNKLKVIELPYVMVKNKTRNVLTFWIKIENKFNNWIFKWNRILKRH